MRGYYVVMYNNNKIYNNKITMGKNVYICYNKKYLHDCYIQSWKMWFNLFKKSFQENGRRLFF